MLNSPASSTEDPLPTREALWPSQLLALVLPSSRNCSRNGPRRELGIGRQPGHRFTGLDEMEIRPQQPALEAPPSPPRLLVRELAGVGKHPHLAQEVRAEAEFTAAVQISSALRGRIPCRKA